LADDRFLNKRHLARSLRFFNTAPAAFVPVFTARNLRSSYCFYSWSRVMGIGLDMTFVGGMAALWGLLALLVWGFEKLEKPQGGRP
jgi:hypothetical protein